MSKPACNIALNLETSMRNRFEKVLLPTSVKFEPIYLVAAYLNPRLTLLVDPEHIPLISRQLIALVILTIIKCYVNVFYFG